MTKTLHGRIRDRTIELDEDLGASDGQEVIVQVKMVIAFSRKAGDGFLRTEGALADDTEWDAIMENGRIIVAESCSGVQESRRPDAK